MDTRTKGLKERKEIRKKENDSIKIFHLIHYISGRFVYTEILYDKNAIK